MSLLFPMRGGFGSWLKMFIITPCHFSIVLSRAFVGKGKEGQCFNSTRLPLALYTVMSRCRDYLCADVVNQETDKWPRNTISWAYRLWATPGFWNWALMLKWDNHLRKSSRDSLRIHSGKSAQQLVCCAATEWDMGGNWYRLSSVGISEALRKINILKGRDVCSKSLLWQIMDGCWPHLVSRS